MKIAIFKSNKGGGIIMMNPKKWLGMKYPDSDLIGLLFHHARPASDQPNQSAIDVGCGSGRHLGILRDLGYRAIGIDNDPVAVANARKTGFDAVVCEASDYSPDTTPSLVVAWGFVAIVPKAESIIARWEPECVILDWRTHNNTFAHWKENERLDDGRELINKKGHILNGMIYRFFDRDDCQLPGYDRIALQTVTKDKDGDRAEWYQTVHRRRAQQLTDNLDFPRSLCKSSL